MTRHSINDRPPFKSLKGPHIWSHIKKGKSEAVNQSQVHSYVNKIHHCQLQKGNLLIDFRKCSLLLHPHHMIKKKHFDSANIFCESCNGPRKMIASKPFMPGHYSRYNEKLAISRYFHSNLCRIALAEPASQVVHWNPTSILTPHIQITAFARMALEWEHKLTCWVSCLSRLKFTCATWLVYCVCPISFFKWRLFRESSSPAHRTSLLEATKSHSGLIYAHRSCHQILVSQKDVITFK